MNIFDRPTKCFAFIFARGGSKGVKNKNIRQLAGRPLIAHSIEKAKSCSRIDRVIVSTDSQDIADVALEYGAEVPFMRPSHLAEDNSSEWDAWQHAVQHLMEMGDDFDVFISLPATSPMRSLADIEGVLDMLSPETDIVITCSPAKRSPYFNMISIESDHSCKIAIQAERKIARRQDAPKLYDITTVAYATRPDYILNSKGIFESDRVRAFVVPEERALDIDSELDFRFAEFLMKEKEAECVGG